MDSGFPIGFIFGLSIGFAVGGKQKPWSELTEKEKKIMMVITIVLASLVVLTATFVFLGPRGV